MHNEGYCGEVSLIGAGLYYGQYVSQFDVRDLAVGSQTAGELLVGVNDAAVAQKLHLAYEEWDSVSESDTDQFLVWVKERVASGYPVAIGVLANQYLFYGDKNPNAGQSDYDHIVTVTNISSKHPMMDGVYYGDDQLSFSDHGLWDDDEAPKYSFSYSFDEFQKSRKEANAKHGDVYSLVDDGTNYGIAITGIKGDTLPVRLVTNLNYEKPEICRCSNRRPDPMPLTLTVTVSNLEPNVPYVLYRYNRLDLVPESEFNAHANQAFEKQTIMVQTGSTYTFTQKIESDEVAVYRAVKATAP